MKINPKSEKGAITLIVLVTMLFLVTFLMTLYIRISNNAQSSSETTRQIAQKYNNIGDAEDIYNSYFIYGDVIPIYTKEQLKKIGSGEKMQIDGKIYTFTTSAHYIIKNDIDLGGYDKTNDKWIAENKWTPLTDKFTGTLDGLGKTITGLYIDNTAISKQGLFGTLNGTVKNLKIAKYYIRVKDFAGTIAGQNNGTIENVQVEAGEVTAKHYIGGIAGANNGGTISKCINNAKVSENENTDPKKFVETILGGIVGYNYSNGIVKECFNNGEIIGINGEIAGIVGNSNVATIEKCENMGTVKQTGTAAENVGGIVGWSSGSITECTNRGNISGAYNDVGGIVGDTKNNGNSITSCTNEGEVTGGRRVGGIIGEGISTQVMSCMNNGNVTGDQYIGGIVGYLDGKSNTSEFSVIDNCSNNQTITNNAKDSRYTARVGGIVGYAYSYCIIRNSNNHGTVKTTNGNDCGGIVGCAYLSCSIYNCYNEGPIGNLSKGGSTIGGISGGLYAESTMSKCYNKGEVSGISLIGGVVGQLADASNAYINNCYNKGEVKSVNGTIGGICAVSSRPKNAEINNCYNIGKITITGNANSYIRRNCRNRR